MLASQPFSCSVGKQAACEPKRGCGPQEQMQQHSIGFRALSRIDKQALNAYSASAVLPETHCHLLHSVVDW
jgi:hypothetical protein